MSKNKKPNNQARRFSDPIDDHWASLGKKYRNSRCCKEGGREMPFAEDKPLPQGGIGGIFGILGAVIAAVFIIGGAVTVFILYRRQKKNRSDTDNDLIDLPTSHKPASLPPNQKQELKSQLTAENIQVVHLDNMKEQEEEVQNTSSQPPYYDMAATESTPHTDKLTAGNSKDSNVQYAELDTSVLTTSPSHRTSIPAGGDLVEYATIQANVC